MYDDRKRDADKQRRTWREIDQLRDKSRARERDPMQKQSSPAALAAQKSYKAALERAFESGKLEELARTLSRASEPQIPSGNGRAAHGTVPPPSPPPPAEAAPPPDAPVEEAPAAAAVPAAPRDPDRENRMKMLARIKEAEGRDPITKAVDAFLARWPKLPDDFEVLTKVLSHKNDDRVREALDQITRLVAREKPRRGRTLAAQLRFLEDTHTDPEIRQVAAAVRAKL